MAQNNNARAGNFRNTSLDDTLHEFTLLDEQRQRKRNTALSVIRNTPAAKPAVIQRETYLNKIVEEALILKDKINEIKEDYLQIREDIREYGFKDYFFYMKPSVGKDGEIIYACKFRTMKFGSDKNLVSLLKNAKFDSMGKVISKKNDRNVTDFAKKTKMREKFYDEIPQIFYNVMWKRNMTLVGPRPVQPEFFDSYSPELQERLKKLNMRPGVIPPHYYSGKGTFEEKTMKYLDEYEKNPLKTRVKYSANIIYNILFKGLRSK